MTRRGGELLRLGLADYNAGRFESALGAFRRARAAGEASAGRFAAHCLAALGRPGEAARALLAVPGGGARALLEVASWRELEGRPEAALAVLERALRVSPKEPGLRPRLAGLLRARAQRAAGAGRLPSAERDLRRALALDPASETRRAYAEAARRLAEGESRRGRAAAAARRLERALALVPEADAVRRALVEALRALAREAALKGRGAQAEASLRRAALVDPLSVDARRDLVELQRLSVFRGEDPASEPAGAAVRRELAEKLAGRATRLEAAGALSRSRVLWDRAARLRAAAPSSRADGFRELARAGDYDAASREGERILDAGPTLYDIRAFVNPWERSEMDALRASHLALLDAFVSRRPRSPWGWLCRGFLRGGSGLADFDRLSGFSRERYGWMYYRAGQQNLCQRRYAKAASQLRLAAAHLPADWRARSYLAQCLLCLGRAEEGLRELSLARDLAPRDEVGAAMAWQAAYLLWLGRGGEAAFLLDWALALGAPGALRWRGACEVLAGRPSAALPLLGEALAVDPSDREARVWRGEALRLLGRAKEAVAELSRGPVGLWARLNRGPALLALGDEAGLHRDFAAVPPKVIDFVRGRAGLPREEAPSPARLAQTLEAALRLARGYRRDDDAYELWMR